MQPIQVLGKRAGYCECGEAGAIDGTEDGSAAQDQNDECESEDDECGSNLPPTAKHPVECGDAWRKAFTCAEECAPTKQCVSW